MSMTNVLVLGNGGREFALGRKISRNPKVQRVFYAPGNGGVYKADRCDIGVDDFPGILSLVKEKEIGFVVIGPEKPLVEGLADYLRDNGVDVFGPSRQAAQLEGSKIWFKGFCGRHGIPTADWYATDNFPEAVDLIMARRSQRSVIKAYGLAQGKGVVVAQNRAEAIKAAYDMLVGNKVDADGKHVKAFGEAGSQIIIEDCLDGVEISAQALCDGEGFLTLPFIRDHKRRFNGDAGPNTGGMGAFSAKVSPEMRAEIDRIIKLFVDGMAEEGMPFQGLMYLGLMLTKDGPMVLECNVRFGDPETQCMMALLNSDLFVYLMACSVPGELARLGPLEVSPLKSLTVVLVLEDYPEKDSRRSIITGMDQVRYAPGIDVCHAGTEMNDNVLTTKGGRIMAITAARGSFEEASRDIDTAEAMIHFVGKSRRTDVGRNAAAAEAIDFA